MPSSIYRQMLLHSHYPSKMANNSIDEFFSEATINEFQLIEEDVTIMKKILRRYLVFSAKKTVEELEKIQPPPAKRARFDRNRHHEGQDQDHDQDQDQAQPEAQPAENNPPPVQQPVVEQQPNHKLQTIDSYFTEAESYIQANPSLAAQVNTIYNEMSALTASPSTNAVCSICGTLFDSIQEMREHLSLMKCTKESLLIKKIEGGCPTCGKQLHCRWRDIELHFLSHIPTVKRPPGRPRKTAEVKF